MPCIMQETMGWSDANRPRCRHTLRALYAARGEQALLAQYHCATDGHLPLSVPPLLGALVAICEGGPVTTVRKMPSWPKSWANFSRL